MRDFADSLDDRLRSLAAYAEPVSRLSLVPPAVEASRPRIAPPASRSARQRLTLRRPVFTGGMATAIGVAATVIVLTGSDSSGLPIFETERSDASALKTNPTLAAADANFDEGHRFMTPDGAGWVLTSNDGRTVCVTLPNRSAPASDGVACGPKVDIERRGLAVELVGDRSIDPKAMNRVAFVLPAEASTVTLTSNRRTIPLPASSGVAVAWLTSAGTLTFRQGGRIERRSFQGAFEGTWYLCDGRKIALKPKSGPNPTIQCP